MRLTSSVLILLFLVSTINAAQVITYVDPDASGNNDGTDWTNAYTSLFFWDANEETDLVTDGDYHTCYCRSSGGTADTTELDVDGWTTGAANYIEIIQADMPTDGVWDASEYRIQLTNSLNGIEIRENYVRIKLQVEVVETGTSTAYGILIYNQSLGNNDIRIYDSIVKGTCSGTGSASGIYVGDPDSLLKIYNTVVQDINSGSDSGFTAINLENHAGTEIYNCTVTDSYYGIADRDNGTVTAKNCAVFNCTDDFYDDASGTFTIDYCASDDGDGTNGVDWENEATDWAANFTDYSNGDFSVKDTNADIYDAGVSDPGSGLYSDDIIGTTRSTWDIGAWEYIAASNTVSVREKDGFIKIYGTVP